VDAVVKTARKILVLIVGGSVVLVGIVMIVAPGPAMLVIPCGLAILATEFVWAARMLKQFQKQAANLTEVTLGTLFRKSARGSVGLPSKAEPGSNAISTIIMPDPSRPEPQDDRPLAVAPSADDRNSKRD